YSHTVFLSAMSAPSSVLSATATPSVYTLSLHDALPISRMRVIHDRKRALLLLGYAGHQRDAEDSGRVHIQERGIIALCHRTEHLDRKSTRLNSSHVSISYAVFCLKKKTNARQDRPAG